MPASCAARSASSAGEWLLNRSVRENIAIVGPGCTDGGGDRGGEARGAHEFISEPRGYDTLVGEQGASPAAATRQRIAIARALFTDRRILILRRSHERARLRERGGFARNMAAICKGRTVIVSPTALSAVANADQIVVLDKAASSRLARTTSCLPSAKGCTRGCGQCSQARLRRRDRHWHPCAWRRPRRRGGLRDAKVVAPRRRHAIELLGGMAPSSRQHGRPAPSLQGRSAWPTRPPFFRPR